MDLHLPGREVGSLETPARAVSGAVPRWLALLGLTIFAGLYIWGALMQVDWAQWPGESLWGGIVHVLLSVGWIPWAALGGFVILSIVLNAVAFRPQRERTETRSVRLEPTR